MKPKEAKDCLEILREIKKDFRDAGSDANSSMNGVAREAQDLKKLWREKNQSKLVKAGVALILFPDPVVSDVVGAGLVAAGLLHDRIKNSGLFLEDVFKTYPRLLKELQSARQSLE
jgi:hypothetical protein